MKSDRIVVVGVCCSGKSTFASRIKVIAGLPLIDQDNIQWSTKWERVNIKEVKKIIENLALMDKWIMDGNFILHSDLLLTRATLIIWLDFPLFTLLIRAFKRTLTRLIKKEIINKRNTESLRHILFSKSSSIYYILLNYKKKRKAISEIFQYKCYSSKRFLIIKSNREVEQFIKNLNK